MSHFNQNFSFLLIVSLVWLVGSLSLAEEFIFSGPSLTLKSLVKSSGIFFEDEAEEKLIVSATSPSDLKQRECWQNGQLFWNATQKCYFAATRGPCRASEWIILTGDPAIAASVECQSMPCPPGQTLFGNDRCHSINKLTSICHARKAVLENNPYGRGTCVCRSELHVPYKNQCYPLFRQGPCTSGEYLRLENYIAVCVTNPCKIDELVLFNARCAKLNSQEPCPGSEVLKVDGDSFELKCQLELRQIGRAPYRCTPRSPIFHSNFCQPKWKKWSL